jgi:hypothetical protein
MVIVGLFLLVIPNNISGQNIHSSFTKFDNPEASSLQYLLYNGSNSTAIDEMPVAIGHFINHLERKKYRYKSEIDFWRYTYYKVHRKFLKHYQSHSTLTDLLENGYYDCLSGTALYAFIFEQLGADYQIIETPYHVFLELHTGGEIILIESTSPLDGFVTDQMEINKLKEAYLNNFDTGEWTNKSYYKYQQSFNNRISLKQLAGLQLFNRAVEAYNNRDLQTALKLQEDALRLYASSRVKEMMAVMLNTLEHDSSLDPFLKQYYLSKYHYLRDSLIVARLKGNLP